MHASLRNQLQLHSTTAATTHTMERRDHGRSLKPLPTWTPGHNFSLAAAAGSCFPWPAQRPLPSSSSSYTCGYCRREFRSAQALGGHMNVHRRDRARLRQCCSPAWPSSSLPAGPNHLAASPHPQQHHRAPLPNLNCSPLHCAAAGAASEAPVIYSFFSTTAAASSTTVAAATKAAAFEVSLELGIGVCGGRGGEAMEEEGLDLELRLGCSCWE